MLALGGLVLIALLTQGLARLGLALEQSGAAWAYLKAVLLSAPQIIQLILPLTVFAACAFAANQSLVDQEAIVARAVGQGPWALAAPALRIAVICALAQLAIGLFAQPAAFSELRRTILGARAGLVGALVEPGAFVSPAPGLAIYAREQTGTRLEGVFLSDARPGAVPSLHRAESGLLLTVKGAPILVLFDGETRRFLPDGSIDTVKFGQNRVPLDDFGLADFDVLFKASDRFAVDLLAPDLDHYWNAQNRDALAAEGHARLSGPLWCLAMAMLAVLAILGAEPSRTGYGQRIAVAALAAVTMRAFAFALQSFAGEVRFANALQYAAPLFCLGGFALLYWSAAPRRRRRAIAA